MIEDEETIEETAAKMHKESKGCMTVCGSCLLLSFVFLLFLAVMGLGIGLFIKIIIWVVS